MTFWIVTQASVERPGGIATHVRLLRQGLQFEGHETHTVSMDRLFKPASRLLISLPLRAVNLARKGDGIRFAVRTYQRFLRRRLLGRIRLFGPPDVFACQDIASAFAVRDIRKELAPNAAVLLTVHSFYTYEKVGQGWIRPHSGGERRVLDMEREGMLSADSLVAVSDKIREHVVDMIGPTIRPIQMLHNAIDVERFCPPAGRAQKDRCRKQFDFPPDVPVVLLAGHLREIKGVHVALESAVILRDIGEQFLMVFAGDGPMRGRLATGIATEGLHRFVRLMPPVPYDRMPTLYRAADILLMPSIPTYRAEESFGLSAVEAMSCGLPVVASRTGGLEEVVRDETTGLLVTPGDAAELAEAVAGLLHEAAIRAELGMHGRDFVVSHHDHVAHARQFAQIGRQTAGTVGPAAVVRMAG